MNKPNFNTVIEDLKQYPDNFDMGCYFKIGKLEFWCWGEGVPLDRISAHEPGTTACIAGRAICFVTEMDKSKDFGFVLHKFLEITMMESNWLIGGHFDQWHGLEEIPVENAIKALEYLRDGGDVNTYKG